LNLESPLPAFWNPSLYTSKHNFVFRLGQGMVELLAPEPGEQILDLGCGTGELTAMIGESGALVTGIDQSPEMISRAGINFPALDLELGDARQLRFENHFDAVFSNATLHWIPQQELVLESVYRALKPGGRFVGELGGSGNIQLILQATEQVIKSHGFEMKDPSALWYFPGVGDYAKAMEGAGFRIQVILYFDRMTRLSDPEKGIVDWLDMFGGYFFSEIPPAVQPALKGEIQDKLQGILFKDGAWHADYKRIRFSVSKPIS
jgi:trans-aconitate methyltransferase